MLKTIWRFILKCIKNEEILVSKDKLQDDMKEDNQGYQQAMKEIKNKSKLFSKIINEEKEKVNSTFDSEMKKMKEEEKKMEEIIKSLED